MHHDGVTWEASQTHREGRFVGALSAPRSVCGQIDLPAARPARVVWHPHARHLIVGGVAAAVIRDEANGGAMSSIRAELGT